MFPSHRQAVRRSARHGFTLIELLLVLVILGVLAMIVVPKLTGRAQEAKVTATKTTISNVKGMLQLFEHDNDRLPSNEEGLNALVNKPSDLPNWHRYADELPLDGWGKQFTYRQPGSDGKEYDIVSFGADGRQGGGDDISN